MAHIEDRWWKVLYEDGRRKRVKSDRHGIGNRYRVRYIDPQGAERSKSFPDGKKEDAKDFLNNIEIEVKAGTYIDPEGGKTDTGEFAKEWLKGLGGDSATKEQVNRRMRKHFIPYFTGRPLEACLTSTIRSWLAALDLEESTKAVLFIYVNSMFEAAVDDRLIRLNPCQAKSLKKPRAANRLVVPWNREQLSSVQSKLAGHYQAMVPTGAGCGFRIGEIFGLAVEDIRFDDEEIDLRRQVKLLGSKRIFAPPKRDSVRTVPLPRFVAVALKEHMERFPPQEVTLPWGELDGEEVTFRLVFTNLRKAAIHRSTFMTNPGAWKRGIAKTAFGPDQDTGTHALRHFYASMFLENGGNIRALADFLGHKDPGFTLRVYGHLMPNSRGRGRQILDDAWGT
ncbi:site-specific integrase [Glycomyces sp. TRM65418]|uniref:tyrosine-type recombinase/integrase n=1 Tax=Glycomyces sp. TRM65418 TaxID=2867006 RepID=UPI001CE628F9|nr:site-specific integrase [Glycomyces sp. TRM65418]MCC3765190.1 site-specific integrase [Glycomyces sp. TRM65418]QZD54815.1 site-specific integrase [Glycomyces sp. TRM65418]